MPKIPIPGGEDGAMDVVGGCHHNLSTLYELSLAILTGPEEGFRDPHVVYLWQSLLPTSQHC